MGAIASLEGAAFAVQPGAEVSVVLRVRNTATVVDEFTFQPVGTGAPWITVEPRTVSLFPGAEASVVVRLAPPRSPDVAPGEVPFAIRVLSREDPTGSVAEEGTVTVGRFEQRSLELFPPSVSGRRRARYELAIDNRGNGPIEVALAGADSDNSCRYLFTPEVVLVDPGSAKFTKLRVTPARRFWKGPAKSHPFQVIATQEGCEAEFVNGSYTQQSMLPPWVLKAALATAVAALALFILWQTLFKSTVQSAARDAVAKPLASLAQRVDAVAPTTLAGPGSGGAGGAPTTTVAGGASGGGTAPGGGTGGATTTTTATGGGSTGSGSSDFSTPFGDPTDFQLGGGTPVAPGAPRSFSQSFTKPFALTDVVLQNPGGDTGTVEVSRNGAVLMTSALENFRDYDLHFVAPYVFNPGQQLVLKVTCTTPAPTDAAGCAVSGSFAGFVK
ncbi:MAG: hypothetical protein ABIQ39_03505 [Ilumatobacteraceae bacterium]